MKGIKIRDIYTALNYLILGAPGQGARVIVGLKKLYDTQGVKSEFSGVQLIISFVIGAVAGMLGAVTLMVQLVDKKFLLDLIAVRYAGADFIEGFMQIVLPKEGSKNGCSKPISGTN